MPSLVPEIRTRESLRPSKKLVGQSFRLRNPRTGAVDQVTVTDVAVFPNAGAFVTLKNQDGSEVESTWQAFLGAITEMKISGVRQLTKSPRLSAVLKDRNNPKTGFQMHMAGSIPDPSELGHQRADAATGRYRFQNDGAQFEKPFSTDEEAFEYAQSMTDGPDLASVEKFMNGQWHGWNIAEQTWRPSLATESVEGTDNGPPYYVDMDFAGDDAAESSELAKKIASEFCLKLSLRGPNGYPRVNGNLNDIAQVNRLAAAYMGTSMNSVHLPGHSPRAALEPAAKGTNVYFEEATSVAAGIVVRRLLDDDPHSGLAGWKGPEIKPCNHNPDQWGDRKSTRLNSSH